MLRTGRPLHPDCCRLKNDLEFDPGSHSVVLSFRATSQDIGLLHVYGYPRDGRRYFVSNPRTVDEGIQIAEDALKDRRWVRSRRGQRHSRWRGRLALRSVLWPGGFR